MQNNEYCIIAEPNYWFLSSNKDSTAVRPSTNPKFIDQWGLFNTLNSNYDVNAIEAWQHSVGQNTKVAVIDGGFQLNHPDLSDNIYAGYDCTNGGDGSVNGQCMIPNDSHGTQCAGIIAAINNNIGIIGIAPNTNLITIRDGYQTLNTDGTLTYHGNTQWIINAINKACIVGADVISCSWSFKSYNSTTYNACINSATSWGRNGKGCIVVFSTGNNSNDTINYPANLEKTIAVGNLKNNGKRYSTSNYGVGLDIVAPGTNIWTTQTIDWGGYCYSTGTSMACPMVAGVAALMLSVNPDLTWQEVRSIIRQTAYKLPAYTFNVATPDGMWNNEVGYGLVDANAAVLRAGTKYIQNKTYNNISNTTINAVNLYAGYSVDNSQTYGNVVIQNGSNVIYKATNQIVLEPGFIALEGSNFVAQIVDVYNLPMYVRPHMPYEAENLTNVESNDKNEVPILSNQLYIYPNLAQDNITIKRTYEFDSITIYTITGQCVLQTTETDIDVSSLHSGVYIVVANTIDGQTQQGKFIHL